MPDENAFFLSTFLGYEKAMGNCVIMLSDCTMTKPFERGLSRDLREGDVVICECLRIGGKFKTIGMAKVLSYKKGTKRPERLKQVWGRTVRLTGREKIIDHRKGHRPGCKCGA